MFDTFGNKVKIKKSAETEEKGLTGKIGEIFGETTPSITDVDIVGSPKEDYALNVYFDDLEESFWFDVDLLEQVGDGQGTTITLDGIDKRWTKGKDGEWLEEDIAPSQGEKSETDKASKTQVTSKRWWEFWKT